MLTTKRIATLLVGVLLGLGIASAVILAGPRTNIVCGSGVGPQGYAERILQGLGAGHSDGSANTYCPVPSAGAWLSAGVVLITAAAVTIVAFRRITSPYFSGDSTVA